MRFEKLKELPIGWIIFFSFYLVVSGFYVLKSMRTSIGDEDVIELRFWNGFTGRDGDKMTSMVKRFNAENDDIHITVQRMQWRTYYNKLFVAGQAEREPEVFISHAKSLPRFVRADFVRPIDDLINGEDGIDTSDIDEIVWESVNIGGQHVGLPIDVHPLGLYYNTKLFEEVGIVDESGKAKPPSNQTEFVSALRKLKKDRDNDGRIDQWGFMFFFFPMHIIHSWMHQFGGGTYFNEDFTECIINNAENRKALEFLVDLIHEQKLIPVPLPQDSAGWDGFKQGRVGMFLGGIFMLNDLRAVEEFDPNNKIEYAGAFTPTVGHKPAMWADSHVACISSTIDDRKAKAAWRFIKYVSDNSLEWASGGQVPVRKSVRELPAFQEMQLHVAFAEQLPYIKYYPKLPYSIEFERSFRNNTSSACLGAVTPEEALEKIQTEMNEIIARDRELYGDIEAN